MKHTKKMAPGGSPSQEAINEMKDREEEREREAFFRLQREENEAPKKAVKRVYNRVRDMLGIGKKKTPTKKANGGSVKSSASKRGDGVAQRGKTKGRFI
jgi:hypothetical protein